MRYLTLTGCRTTETLKDLSLIDGSNQYNGRDVGLHINISKGQSERSILEIVDVGQAGFIANVLQLH